MLLSEVERVSSQPVNRRPTMKTLKEFEEQCGITILWSGELDLPLYKRFMVIGRNV